MALRWSTVDELPSTVRRLIYRMPLPHAVARRLAGRDAAVADAPGAADPRARAALGGVAAQLQRAVRQARRPPPRGASTSTRRRTRRSGPTRGSSGLEGGARREGRGSRPRSRPPPRSPRIRGLSYISSYSLRNSGGRASASRNLALPTRRGCGIRQKRASCGSHVRIVRRQCL